MNILDQLVGIGEIAELAGTTTQAVWNWRNRYVDFPHPVKVFKMGPVFLQYQVEAWLTHHKKGK